MVTVLIRNTYFMCSRQKGKIDVLSFDKLKNEFLLFLKERGIDYILQEDLTTAP